MGWWCWGQGRPQGIKYRETPSFLFSALCDMAPNRLLLSYIYFHILRFSCVNLFGVSGPCSLMTVRLHSVRGSCFFPDPAVYLWIRRKFHWSSISDILHGLTHTPSEKAKCDLPNRRVWKEAEHGYSSPSPSFSLGGSLSLLPSMFSPHCLWLRELVWPTHT